MSGCIRSEQPSSEADITAFSLPENIEVESDIDQTNNSIYLTVDSKFWGALTNIAPKIKLSAKATVNPPSGTPVDLTNTALRYVVTAENGVSTKTYSIMLDSAINNDTVLFSFDSWSISKDGYYVSDNHDWSNGNAGVTMGLTLLGIPKIPESYPSQMTTDGKSGCAVKLETKRGGKILFFTIPVWSGNFFLGNFNTSKVMNPLEATEFGRTYKHKPKILQGYYKYREGSGKYNDNGTEVDRADSCSIYAVFYRADKDTTLNAYGLDTSPLILARADLADGSSTVGDDFHKFSIEFGQYKEEPDFENHHYKLAIVFSSSARGATATYENGQPSKEIFYAGKVGSTLIVDEVMVINY
jgi:hypothetical protein